MPDAGYNRTWDILDLKIALHFYVTKLVQKLPQSIEALSSSKVRPDEILSIAIAKRDQPAYAHLIKMQEIISEGHQQRMIIERGDPSEEEKEELIEELALAKRQIAIMADEYFQMGSQQKQEVICAFVQFRSMEGAQRIADELAMF